MSREYLKKFLEELKMSVVRVNKNCYQKLKMAAVVRINITMIPQPEIKCKGGNKNDFFRK